MTRTSLVPFRSPRVNTSRSELRFTATTEGWPAPHPPLPLMRGPLRFSQGPARELDTATPTELLSCSPCLPV